MRQEERLVDTVETPTLLATRLLPQVPTWHTLEEWRLILDWVHWIEGAVFVLAALVILAQTVGYLSGSRLRYLWPGLVLFAGMGLLGVLLLPHHREVPARMQWAFVIGDPQQRQHLVLGILIIIAGAVELLLRAGRLRTPTWQVAWPAALIIIGVLSIVHVQHGPHDAVARALLFHRLLGVLLIATGLLRVGDVASGSTIRWLSFSWGLTLLAAGVILIVYREPELPHGEQHTLTSTRSP